MKCVFNVRLRLRLCLCVFSAATFAGGGCTGFGRPASPIENVTPERTQREQELNANFGQQRDEAQYQAAVQSWNSGDPQGCQTLLGTLLERNPKHKDARQLLADLYLEEGDSESARQVLEELLVEFPSDAHIHHSLGLLYEATNERTLSLRHLARAVEIEPQNEFYRMCHQATLSTSSKTGRSSSK